MRNGLVMAIVGLLFCGTALGDLSGLTGWTDPNGFTWEGTKSLSAEKASEPNTFLSADIEWVVEYVSAQSKFKYTYQVTSTGDYPVTLLGLALISSNKAENIGSYLVEAGDIAPLSSAFVPGPPAEPTMASWSFAGLTNGQISYGLTYWSVNAPMIQGGYIQDGGIFAANGDIASPSDQIPGPATLTLLVLGAAAFLPRRRRR